MATNSKKTCDHEENRYKVCAVCGRKIVFGSNPRLKFVISEKIEILIKNFSNNDFTLLDSRFPKGICFCCKVVLYERNEGKTTRNLPAMPNFLDIQLLKETRSRDNQECCCLICRVGKQKIHTKIVNGRGVKRDSISVTTRNGLLGTKKTVEVKNLVANSDEMSNVTPPPKICTICFAELFEDKVHLCNQNEAPKNVLTNIGSFPEKTQDNILHKLLASKAKISNSSANLRNVEMTLKTGGRNARVVLNPVCKNPVFFSEDKLDNFVANTGLLLINIIVLIIKIMIVSLGMTLNQMEKVTNFIRTTAGKKSVPPYYRHHASKKAKVLEDVYQCGAYDFDVEKMPEKEKRPVVYADADDLLNVVLEARNQHGEIVIKLMADGGKGFFKISMTILPKDYSQETSDSDIEEIPPKKKRTTYEEGGTLGKKANLNGVNRLIMLCVVPNIKETYDNVKILWDLMNLNKIPFKFVSDYKLLLIIIGQQTASSTYPCPFCFIILSTLRSGEVGSKVPCSVKEGCEELEIAEECLKLKTFGDLKESYKKFAGVNFDKRFAKNCQSTVNLPLFDEDDEMPVIEKVIIPELHEIQGIVNHIFFDGLVPLLGRENALKWPKKLNLISKHYHGEKFEGNACRRLLKEADKLNDKDILQSIPILKVIPFIQLLKTFNKLVDATFKSEHLHNDWQQYVNELKLIFPATGLSHTLKVHVLFEHLEHGLHFLNGDSLGLWSEQAGESVHREFLKYWSKYQVNNLESENYCTQLKRAVVEFSSRHLPFLFFYCSLYLLCFFFFLF